jgi:troponin T
MSDEPLEEADKQLLQDNQVERDRIAEEIKELRERNERRKHEREEEEKRLAAERAAEDARRKAEEEERKRKKEEDEINRRKALELKRAEFEKWKTPQKANFVISKKTNEDGTETLEMDEEGEAQANKKSKEQLEAEKKAILSQRIKPLQIDGFDQHQLSDKAKELHNQLTRLEGEKYDLEKRFKQLQVEMMELAERARQANRVGKEGGLKRIAGAEDEVDKIQTRFAGAPAKVEMFSKYERQKDKRSYRERKVVYTGPQYLLPAERIRPTKSISWNEEGMPQYHEGAGEAAPQQEMAPAAAEPEPVQ